MYKMAFYNLPCRRLFIYLPLMLVLCSMTSGRDHNNSPSPSEHKRTVALNKASERFLALIFEDYSDNSTRRISASRFNDILKELNLGEVTSAEQSAEDKPNEYHTHEHRPVKQPSLRNSRRKGPSKDAQNSQNFQDREQRKVHENRHEQRKQRCLKEQDLLRIHQVSETKGVSQEDFVRICPSLVHQLLEGACIEVQESESEDEENTDPKMLQVWGYGVLSITVISLTSLLAIGIIPLMGRSIYKKIMSFLVALAVGTLSGDALLHLIPHAFDSNHTGDSDKSDGHKINVYKSCVIMAGIYVFFMVECAMKARLGRRKQTQHNIHVCDDVTTPDEMSLNEKKKCAKEYQAMVGSRLAGTHRCISYDDAHFPKVSGPLSRTYKPSSCELVIVEPAKEVRSSNTPESSQEKVPLWEPSCHGHHCYQRDSMSEASKHSYSDTELISALYGKSCIHPNLYINEKFAGNASDSSSQTNRGVSQGHCHRGHGYRYQVTSVTTDTSTDDAASESGDQHYEENHNHHHHHHHHSHKIDKNTSIATVAWMVIVGDGFHNFSDGLAVGAAFSASLTSGLTTAIAVFCHELPHELGDFAILLKSGLTFRQAVAYNFASAIISYIGLVLGIIIGDMESAHSWVLALTAGMFLYISLVDMLPELSNFLEEGGGLSVVLSQNIGILTGVAIMLVIALYET